MLPSEKMLKIKMLPFGKHINPLLVAPLQEAERKVALCDLALSTPSPVKMLFLPGSSTFILTFFPVGSILSQGRAVRPCDKMLPSGKMLKIKVLLFGKQINPLGGAERDNLFGGCIILIFRHQYSASIIER